MKHYSFSRRLRLPPFRVLRTLTRVYHSEHHPPPPPFSKTEDQILAAAISHVPAHGFSAKALALGVKQAGYLPVSIQLFPRGVFDLVYYHLVTQRLALKKHLQFPEESKLGVDERVRVSILERLSANKPIIHQWQSALGHMSLLENIPASLKELHALSDEICYLAGDENVDQSWYTKRASLAAVYASSELFMTTDTSHDYAATEEFVDRRLGDLQKIGGTVTGLTQFLGFWAGSGLNLARSWGMRV